MAAASDAISKAKDRCRRALTVPHDGGGCARGAMEVEREREVRRLDMDRGWAGRGVVTMVGLVAVAAGERAGTNERPAKGPASPAKASHK